MMIAAIDQHVADAGGAHFAERDFLRVVVRGHGRIIKEPSPAPASFVGWVGTIAVALRMDGGGAFFTSPGFNTSPGAALALRRTGSTFEGWGALPSIVCEQRNRERTAAVLHKFSGVSIAIVSPRPLPV